MRTTPHAGQLTLASIALALLLLPAHALALPNVLMVLLDDLGVNDLGVNGSTQVTTPNMDRLAREGLLFTRHYADRTCTPSRVALMTGRHPARLGYRGGRGRGMSPQLVTLAEHLKAHGYRTSHIGKWHLGGAGLYALESSPPQALPTGQGFDTWTGFIQQALLGAPAGQRHAFVGKVTYLNPWLTTDEQPQRRYTGHLTDILTGMAEAVIRAGGNSREPWFLNLWYFAPHEPLQPAEPFAQRHPSSPRGRYLALIEQLDSSIGRLLKALEETGQARDTLVVLLSDNGGNDRTRPSNFPFKGKKNSFREGGIRTPLIMRYPGRLPAGRRINQPVSVMDVFPTLSALIGADETLPMDGRSLLPLIEEGAQPQRPLFWERYDGPGRTYYSVLSEDGRWRLISHGDTQFELYDLLRDPAGATDLHDSYPAVVEGLAALYRQWQGNTSRTDTRFKKQSETGGGILTGDDFQRAPGWNGLTFGIGLVPDEPRATPPRSGPAQNIATQAGVWQLTYASGKGVRVRLREVGLAGGRLRPMRCNSVIVSIHARNVGLEPRRSQGLAELYVNGELLDRKPFKPSADFRYLDQPTRVGLAAGETTPFQGSLSPPVVLNLPLVEMKQQTVPSISSLATALCGGLQGERTDHEGAVRPAT